jgi:hypothetical protein
VSAQPEPQPGGQWAAAAPEIVIAAIVVACATVTGYAAAGLPGAAVVTVAAAVAALAVLRVIGPAQAAPPADGPADGTDSEAIPGTFAGYWRRRAGLTDATQSLTAYDAGLRLTLQHLLAAQLAERHGVSLRADPATARRLLCPHPRDQALWYWVDPARPPVTTGSQRGIPPRTLAQLIDRLERL